MLKTGGGGPWPELEDGKEEEWKVQGDPPEGSNQGIPPGDPPGDPPQGILQGITPMDPPGGIPQGSAQGPPQEIPPGDPPRGIPPRRLPW